MLHRLPKNTPPLAQMLADIGNPSPEQVARVLGVSRGSVYRWLKDEEAPRPVMLALFWLTQWGVSQINCNAHNDALQQAQIAACYRSQVKEAHALLRDAQAQLAHLGRIGNFGAANDPTPEGLYRVPALPMLAILGDPVPAPPVVRTKSHRQIATQKRAELAARRLAKRAESEPKPFDYLRVG